MTGHIFLIGFMGTGKSTVAAELAGRVQIPVREMDAEIERSSGMAINDIFAQQGEAAFRDMESAYIRNLAGQPPCIVSCGGGCVLRAENVARMKQSGRIVWLTAAPETVFERVRQDSSRPLLRNNMNIAHIRSMLEQRHEAYEAASDIITPTDGRTPQEIADDIINQCNLI